ncbi:MAG: hypothetical protein KIT58_20830 [Planctomycetota bacterium]|nr:hypothetical protein [Planctomycetota bacterium]
MRAVLTLAFAIGLVLAAPAPARATTWGPAQVACPLCGHENAFERPMSYGSYIYRWPSRFQLVFWPATEGRSLYSCAGCRLTCFMWDWPKRITPEHHARLREVLAEVTLPAAESYRKVPILDRLAVAEKVYEVVGLDAATRCRFYRTVGYHAAKKGQPERARAARQQALDLARALADDPAQAAEAKEHRVVVACLLRLLGDPEGARAALEAAAGSKIEGDDAERAQGRTEYLDELIAALREKLDAGDLSDDAPERDHDH